MREDRLGMIASLTVHSCVIPLLIAASFSLERRPVKTVEVDFSLIKDQLTEYSVPQAIKKPPKRGPQIRRGEALSGRMTEPVRRAQKNQEVIPAKEEVEPPPSPTIVTASDTQSETVIHGVAATYADSTGAVNSLRSHGGPIDGASGEGRGGGLGDGNGGGQGSVQGAGGSLSEGSRDYNYIRDAVMKNTRYPTEAIRLGIEGRALISFIVLENGTTGKIKVESSSGYRLLDESAKEAVAITRIYKKVPYRVAVHLPIAYKLRE